MTKVFALHLFGCMEIFVLILMAVDCYVAICKPLRYPVIMRRQVCVILVILAWIRSLMHSTVQIVLSLRLPFCGPNLMEHYGCDLQPLLNLACMDTDMINLLLVSKSGAICSSILKFWLSHILSSCILCVTTVQKEEKRYSLPAPLI